MNAPDVSEVRKGRWPIRGVLIVCLLVFAAAFYRMTVSPEPSTTSNPKPRSPIVTDSAGALRSSTPVSTVVPVLGPPSPPAKVKPKEPLFEIWRTALLTKNAEEVMAVERSFLGNRARFHDGLAELAEKDDQERVRSFSTRILGKFAMAGDVDLFARLLQNDPSPYVRHNAAWALGELRSGVPVEVLSRVSEGDPDEEVRAAATKALSRIR